jgi:hypothetical protein
MYWANRNTRMMPTREAQPLSNNPSASSVGASGCCTLATSGLRCWRSLAPCSTSASFLFVAGLTDWFYVHHVHLPATVLRSGPVIVMAWVGMSASGRLVGATHCSQGASMVLVYCATLPLPTASAVLWQIVAHGSYAGPPASTRCGVRVPTRLLSSARRRTLGRAAAKSSSANRARVGFTTTERQEDDSG